MIQSKTHRYQALDSLRSLAALVVVLAHAQTMFHFYVWNLPWPISGLLDSRAAVAFFFVLSGFVLHLSVSKTSLSLSSFAGFQLRRIFRIYPLYFLSLLAVVAAIYLQDRSAFHSFGGNDGSKIVLAANHRDAHQWLQQILLVGPGFDMYFLNPPAWTLAVEMRMAFIFPFFSWFISSLNLKKGILFLFLSFPVSFIVGTVTHLEFIELIPLFLMGAFFAQHRLTILNVEISFKQMIGLAALALILYGSRAGLQELGSVGWYVWSGESLSQTALRNLMSIGWYVCGLGSLGFLGLSLRCAAVEKFLRLPTLVFFGELSYGIYILHFAVLLGLSTQVSRFSTQAVVILFGAALLLTVGISFICYRLIELPLIEMGRKLSARSGKMPKLPAK